MENDIIAKQSNITQKLKVGGLFISPKIYLSDAFTITCMFDRYKDRYTDVTRACSPPPCLFHFIFTPQHIFSFIYSPSDFVYPPPPQPTYSTYMSIIHMHDQTYATIA